LLDQGFDGLAFRGTFVRAEPGVRGYLEQTDQLRIGQQFACKLLCLFLVFGLGKFTGDAVEFGQRYRCVQVVPQRVQE